MKKDLVTAEKTDKTIKKFVTLGNIISILFSIVPCIICLIIFFNFKETFPKIIFTPILYGSFCNLGYFIAKTLNKTNIKSMFIKMYKLIFFTYWFGMLFYHLVTVIIQNKDYFLGIFTIPFWIAGFFAFYIKVIKNK